MAGLVTSYDVAQRALTTVLMRHLLSTIYRTPWKCAEHSSNRKQGVECHLGVGTTCLQGGVMILGTVTSVPNWVFSAPQRRPGVGEEHTEHWHREGAARQLFLSQLHAPSWADSVIRSWNWSLV